MNCQEFWNTMPDFNGDADHPHLDACADCRARVQRRQELAAGLRAVAASFHNVQAPSRVEARLLSAFREQSGVAPIRVKRRWIPAATWAAAFAAMFALAAFVVRDRQPQPERATASPAMERAAAETPADFDGFIPLPNAVA